MCFPEGQDSGCLRQDLAHRSRSGFHYSRFGVAALGLGVSPLSAAPGEWHSRDPFAAPDRPPIPFFQYSARLGRHILLAQRQAVPAAAEHWRCQGLTTDFLTDFWQRIWSSQQARRTIIFQWLVAHRAIAVGTWLSFGGRPLDCSGCGHPQESQRHCLWDCPLAQQIWQRILRIVSYTGAT